MSEEPLTELRAREELARRQYAQSVVNACHRLAENPDFKLFRENVEKVMGMDMPSFIPPYDTHLAAIRDGQKSVFMHFDSLLKKPVTGDANLKPKKKVRS